jgi:hypothetical protein
MTPFHLQKSVSGQRNAQVNVIDFFANSVQQLPVQIILIPLHPDTTAFKKYCFPAIPERDFPDFPVFEGFRYHYKNLFVPI